ncbi:TetR/AcrR family transcriptional regulator [Methylophaga thalassica]|jgi:TetR/AcrR family transcriptional repressor of nem operon|uniref:TetR/AcrR family transcriptional regulator n=1 Tax=Methylophaga thalassica TaxID=40223 RepID=UPI002E7AC4CA|nr:TetR/AcrR family transcriptional regulator [Methylophaga thalassica]WVI84116.1 TetR/AcrR family transcriptional regulator [Methylophaga thalassica]
MGRPATDTKQKLISTASELIWKNSYGSVSVDDICKAAEVKKGSFYHYFKSKADLALASMEDHFENSKQDYERIFSQSVPPIKRFEGLVEHIIEKQSDISITYQQVCGCPYATLGSEMAGQDQDIREKVDSILKRYEDYYASAIRDMVAQGQLPKSTDIECLAAELYCYITGQVILARIHNSLEPLKRDLKNGVFRILNVKDMH